MGLIQEAGTNTSGTNSQSEPKTTEQLLAGVHDLAHTGSYAQRHPKASDLSPMVLKETEKKEIK